MTFKSDSQNVDSAFLHEDGRSGEAIKSDHLLNYTYWYGVANIYK